MALEGVRIEYRGFLQLMLVFESRRVTNEAVGNEGGPVPDREWSGRCSSWAAEDVEGVAAAPKGGRGLSSLPFRDERIRLSWSPESALIRPLDSETLVV